MECVWAMEYGQTLHGHPCLNLWTDRNVQHGAWKLLQSSYLLVCYCVTEIDADEIFPCKKRSVKPFLICHRLAEHQDGTAILEN